jgi:hypothetical protein
MSLNSVIIALILLIAAVSLSTSAPITTTNTAQTITYAQFLALQIGSTREQITQFFNNNPGEVISETAVGTIDIQIVQYTNTNPFGIVMLTLTNNQLTVKTQSGLNQNQYPINLTQYNEIKIDMTRAQVTSLVGSEGQVLAQGTDSIVTVGYNGNGNTFAMVEITFSNGAVISKFEYGL